MLAMSGEDRYQRVWPDDPQAAQEPLCVHCNQGADYPDMVTISAWCNDYGHDPFGTSHATSWQAATEHHRAALLRQRLPVTPSREQFGRTIESP